MDDLDENEQIDSEETDRDNDYNEYMQPVSTINTKNDHEKLNSKIPDEYSKGMHASQTQKNLERKRMDAKMSVDGYMDKNA